MNFATQKLPRTKIPWGDSRDDLALNDGASVKLPACDVFRDGNLEAYPTYILSRTLSEPSREESIFLTAFEKPSQQQRDDYIEEACAGDADLLERVQQLFQSHEQSRGPLDALPPGLEPTADLPPAILSKTQIGPYKLLQQIGEGGFGVVYMAEQTEPLRRQVALKIIKPGMDTHAVIARFEAERQALALMDHTNIARVLDAGTTAEGRPYFVMELVKGLPITEYCDRQNLDTRARLQLFIPVCRAVQHAHQKGIIHRDIKPSNVMVTLYDSEPVPKVIDFGIAKATSQKLTEKTLFTAYGQFVGTPQYMSPEQSELSALDIDTRADIYGLGALLYELLSGQPPFDPERLRSAGFAEVLRIIREEEPLLPSQRLSTLGQTASKIAHHRHVEPKALNHLLRGDLDWIVMKALQKDRNRRYATPNDLATDIERHLNMEPIHARPVSAWERRWRWCRRNPVVSSLTAMLMFAIAAGFVGVASQWWRAENFAKLETQARKNAEHQSTSR